MVAIYYKTGDKIVKENNLYKLSQIDINNLIWVDLNRLDETEKRIISTKFHIKIQDQQELQEIESSSRFIETEKMITANSNFLVYHPENEHTVEPASFILKNNYLVTVRSAEFKSFNELKRRVELNPRKFRNGYDILMLLLQIRIDFDADHLELIANDISRIGRDLLQEEKLNQDTIYDITELQETTMMLRLVIIDKQRIISSMLKSKYVPGEFDNELRIMIKDINSLLEHAAFSFHRLEYLQDTFLGLVNIEQNKIIKIFTVAAVIFMPPTLIASIYGMNFNLMPETKWDYGYPFSIGLMIVSVGITLYFFRKKGWL
ncbi:MAG: magnesium/cobalt transporter CorA [Solitalea sp.]